ncbi:ribosome maturation factor RimM [Buchnera aphidicola]|uniref:ribosome maturation factor RimM n=1 Tax=Buchnera aphidicola TaxID=9 RepID=UPI0031B698E1
MKKKNIESFIVIGKIGAPYGIKGLIKIFSYTQKKEDIFNYLPWFIKNKIFEKILITYQRKIKEKFLVKFKNFFYREQLKPLTNKKIWINKNQLPILKKNEYYWNQIVGLSVLNIKKKKIGTIIDLIDNKFYDILIIKNILTMPNNILYVPFIEKKIVKEVNIKKNYILIDWNDYV